MLTAGLPCASRRRRLQSQTLCWNICFKTPFCSQTFLRSLGPRLERKGSILSPDVTWASMIAAHRSQQPAAYWIRLWGSMLTPCVHSLWWVHFSPLLGYRCPPRPPSPQLRSFSPWFFHHKINPYFPHGEIQVFLVTPWLSRYRVT